MRKQVSFTVDQYARFKRRMQEAQHTTASAFIVELLNNSEKRPHGRPRSDEVEESTSERYMSPRGVKKGPMRDRNAYTFEELKNWYEFHPEDGPMPTREDLTPYPKD